MGDRANIYLEMPDEYGEPRGIYLYTHYYGEEWAEKLREALEFGRGRWNDAQYLARIITSRVFSDLVDSELGGGISLVMGDNDNYPIIVCDLINNQVSRADEGSERDRSSRYAVKSFADFVEQERPECDGPVQLWKLERTGGVGYDENAGFIVAASTEESARDIAGRAAADEGSSTWWDTRLSSCVLIGAATDDLPSGVVQSNFRAG